jgi:hypothetical protein
LEGVGVANEELRHCVQVVTGGAICRGRTRSVYEVGILQVGSATKPSW